MFRNIANSKIGIALAILFGLSLLFWRQSSTITGFFNSNNAVAKIGEAKITTSKYVRTLEMNIRQFKSILGDNFNSKQIQNLQLHHKLATSLMHLMFGE